MAVNATVATMQGVEALLAIALQGALIGILFLGTGFYIVAGMALTLVFPAGGRYGVFLGRWWYSTVPLFPLGYLFACSEADVWAWIKGTYCRQVACCIALLVGSVVLAIAFGMLFYHPLAALAFESLTAICSTWGLLLLSLRRNVRGGLAGRVLGFCGGLTLELYLMHGFFVNLFHQPFYDKGSGIFTIGSPALYILTVLAFGTVFALLFKQVTRRLLGRKTALRR